MKTPYRVLIRKSDIDFLDVNDLPETMEDLGNDFIASYLTEEQYENQLFNIDALWKCPVTRVCGEFDVEWYESDNNNQNEDKKNR
jgi:RNAse (barnase) inhibitor barstar